VAEAADRADAAEAPVCVPADCADRAELALGTAVELGDGVGLTSAAARAAARSSAESVTAAALSPSGTLSSSPSAAALTVPMPSTATVPTAQRFLTDDLMAFPSERTSLTFLSLGAGHETRRRPG
jgi:hypothetical protein